MPSDNFTFTRVLVLSYGNLQVKGEKKKKKKMNNLTISRCL